MVEITLKGSPAQIGQQRGQQLKYAIQLAMEHWLMGHASQWTLEEARSYGRRMAEEMNQRCPDFLDEMATTAQGADVPLEDLYAYVFRCWNKFSDHPANLACYNLYTRDPQRGGIIGGVVEDSPPYYLVEKIFPDQGIPCIVITWAGMPWAIRSMNQSGLTLGQASSFAGTRFREGQHQLPFDLYARGFFAQRWAIQTATTASEAIEILRSFEVASTFMIADRTDKAITLESCGILYAVREPDVHGVMTGGVFEAPELIKALIDEGVAHDWEEGIRMSKRISSRLREAQGKTTMEWMAEYLQTEKTAGGWCHDGVQSATVACPSTGEFWVSGYRPCTNGFKRYQL